MAFGDPNSAFGSTDDERNLEMRRQAAVKMLETHNPSIVKTLGTAAATIGGAIVGGPAGAKMGYDASNAIFGDEGASERDARLAQMSGQPAAQPVPQQSGFGKGLNLALDYFTKKKPAADIADNLKYTDQLF